MSLDRKATMDLSTLHRDAETNIALLIQLIEHVKERLRRTRALLGRLEG